ncbi:hypothetical protein [Geminocystis sp. NIES-3709]|uniref:hypothetical protein n=1 Tax=Geminocystis sp. NIES-3709 TaxID=1617448 RepID=UPI0005FCC5E7|nr:hypothetical protein [Geminocystis sp. NIES-3709]BAQ66502.1 myosin heavy chain [Geminocystis sp. NIES-3709]
MSQAQIRETKEQIMTAFGKLFVEYQQKESKIETKEEAVEKEKNKALLAKVADYTVNNIVNSMATLQLDFSNLTKEIANRLENESNVLTELKKAIIVEQEKLTQLQKVRLVADALYILRQEHQERIKILENSTQNTLDNITQQQEKYHKNWEKEQTEFDLKIAEESALLIQQREQQEADFTYQLQIERKIQMDEYEEAKRLQERELALANQDKNKSWEERETILANQEEEFTLNQEKITGFEEQIKTEVNKARSEAIKEADREAQIKANLIEKEWESTKQGYDFKIQSLDAKIQQQNHQIEEIITQLKEVTNQAQNLALRAFQPNNN